MNDFNLDRALCLPEAEIELLRSGRSISALPRTLIDPNWQFALYAPGSLAIQAAAVCTWCRMLEPDDLPRLAQATHWSLEALEQKAQEQPYLFLAALRVIALADGLMLPAAIAQEEKLGRFVSLSAVELLRNPQPVLSDRLFARRAHQLKTLEPEVHGELMLLQLLLQADKHASAQAMAAEARALMGWEDHATQRQLLSEPWIGTISTVGNSSDGHLFEKLVRRSFLKLGFQNHSGNSQASLDPNSTGGAGGIDFYCDFPYAIVGECKASGTEKVPDSTPAQLVKLGLKILPQADYESAIKIILAAGTLTPAADQTAQGNRMNVLRPETLQRLVALKDLYPGAVDLLKLKPFLEQAPFGEAADAKINLYIEDCNHQLVIRAHTIVVIKNHLEDPNVHSAGIHDVDDITAFSLYCASSPPQGLTLDEFKALLIELSSPLTGYLGRTATNRYYFLRRLEHLALRD